jgi:hypothetical protein
MRPLRCGQINSMSQAASRCGKDILGAMVDEPAGNAWCNSLIQQRLYESNFRKARAVDVDRQRQTGAVDQVPAWWDRSDHPFFCRCERAVGEALLPIDTAPPVKLLN